MIKYCDRLQKQIMAKKIKIAQVNTFQFIDFLCSKNCLNKLGL